MRPGRETAAAPAAPARSRRSASRRPRGAPAARDGDTDVLGLGLGLGRGLGFAGRTPVGTPCAHAVRTLIRTPRSPALHDRAARRTRMSGYREPPATDGSPWSGTGPFQHRVEPAFRSLRGAQPSVDASRREPLSPSTDLLDDQHVGDSRSGSARSPSPLSRIGFGRAQTARLIVSAVAVISVLVIVWAFLRYSPFA